MSIKGFFIRQYAKHKMKNVPESQRELLIGMVEKNPDLFKKMGEEIERRKKGGENETKAATEVMKKYRAELAEILDK